MIHVYFFWIGITFLVVGLFLLSPLADFLPIDFWSQLKQLVVEEKDSKIVYIRVVKGEPSKIFQLALTATGVALIATSAYLKLNK